MSLFEAALPPSWRWSSLGDHFEITRKPRGGGGDTAELAFIPMEAIPQDGSYEPASYATKTVAAITSGTYVERGDLLVSKITPSFENGKQALVINLPGPTAYATTEVIPLRVKTTGYSSLLAFFYLLHPEVRAFVAERMEGSTGRQRVPEQVLLGLAYPEIPPEEQVSIARALELVQQAIAGQRQSARTTSLLKCAAMAELFTRGLRGETQKETEVGLAPESWRIDALGAHHSVSSGGTPSRGNQAYWSEGVIPWVKTTEVNYCLIESAEEHITELGLKESAAKLLPPGTLLMAMYGQGVTRGKVAILGIPAACNQACAAINATDDAVLGRYLYHYLTWRYEEIRQLAHGGQQQNLNLDIVRALPVAAPNTRTEQQEIISILDELDRKIDLHQQKRATLEHLFKALLHKLVTGEICVADLDLAALGKAGAAASVEPT